MSIARLAWVLPIRKLLQHANHSQAFAKPLNCPACLDMLVGKLPNSISAPLHDAKKPLATRGHSAANRLLIADHLASHTVAILAHFV